MVGYLIGFIVSLLVALLSGISVWRQTRWYSSRYRYKRARSDYRKADRNVRVIFQDAHRKMARVKRSRSERYDPDLGSWDWQMK